jgi:hypothetical protein
VRALASFSATEVEDEVQNFFATNLTFTAFTEIILTEEIRQKLISEISGVQNFTFSEFRRNTGSTADIEPLVFARNEVSVFSVDLYNVTVVS